MAHALVDDSRGRGLILRLGGRGDDRRRREQ